MRIQASLTRGIARSISRQRPLAVLQGSASVLIAVYISIGPSIGAMTNTVVSRSMRHQVPVAQAPHCFQSRHCF